MLRIIFQTALIFIEIMLALVGAVGAAFLLREYVRSQKNITFLFGALVLFITGLGQLVVLTGQVVVTKGGQELGEQLVSMQGPLVLIGALSVVLYVASAYTQRARGFFYAFLSLAFILPFAILFLESNFGVSRSIYGALFPSSSQYEFLTYLLPLNIAYILLLICSAIAYKHKHNPADGHLLLSGIAAVTMSFLGLLSSAFEFHPGALLMLFVLLIHQILFFTGASAKGNQNQKLALKPFNILRRSLIFQMAVTSVLAFFIFTLTLAAASSNYFSGINLQNEIIKTEGILVHDSEGYSQQVLNARREAVTLARYLSESATNRDIVERIDSWSGNHPDLFIDVADTSGRIVWSDKFETEVRDSVPTIDASAPFIVVARLVSPHDDNNDFAPHPSMALTEDFTYSGGSVIVSQPLLPRDLMLQMFGENLAYSGLVGQNGELIYSSGNVPSNQQIAYLKSLATKKDEVTLVETDEAVILGVAGLYTPEGASKGFVYRYILQEDWDAKLFSGLVNIAAVSVMFGFALLMLLFFLVHLKLRPVAEIERAALKLREGEYDVRIEYDGPDELGNMSRAFNSMSESLRTRTDFLKEKVREQRDFVNYIAHELKTPAGAVRWALEMLISGDAGKYKTERKELLVHAYAVNENMRNLITELLDFSRMERGAIELHLEEFSIVDVIHEVLESRRMEFESSKFRVNVKTPSRGLPLVHADRQRIKQVMENLVGNAYKYGGLSGQIDVSVSRTNKSGPSGQPGKYVRVSVRDYGIGIPKAEQEHVFKRFFRAENAVDSGIEGTGLGLHITKRLVMMHGGEVWFSSRFGKGTKLTFTIPLDKAGS